MEQLEVFKTFGKGQKTSIVKGTNCVVYTRVSSKDQTLNLSLETQRKACLEYAQRRGLSVLKNFGATAESAKTDNERGEFTAMMSYVKKSKERISYILVYSLERFSRNDNAIWLSNQLRKLGIEIIAVTQPIDTANPSGKMHQKMMFLIGEFDNELRKEKCLAGIRETLFQGNWPTRPPLGYDIVKINGKRTIVVNETGKVLRLAFHWKADESLTHDAIRERLATHGVNLSRQRVTDLLHNPFYCGLMAHNLLEGTVLQGNHEPIVSKELFLKVNGILEQFNHGYTVTEENDHTPLKRFLRCEKCSQFLRGYIVKKKNSHYYKCCTIGCANNRNANVLNQRFASLLEVFKLDVAPDVLNLIKQQAIATFNQFTEGYRDTYKQLQEQYTSLEKKINRLEERFIEEELTADLYNKYVSKYVDEKKALQKELETASTKVSNLADCVNTAVDFALNLPKKWLSADYHTKQRLQFLLFPDGIWYDRETDRCRTSRINYVFSYIAYLKQLMIKKQRGIPELNLDYASLAVSVG
jgi:site-specific DNA recombinase